MANESDGSSVSSPTSVQKRTRDIRQSKRPPEQTLHQPSGSAARLSSSHKAARTAASSGLNLYGAETGSARSTPCPNLGAERSISVRGLQQHPDNTNGAAGAVPVIDSTQVPPEGIHPLTGSARPQLASSFGASETSTPKRDPQNRAADPDRHERQLHTSPRCGLVERGVQIHTVLSGACPSDAGPSRRSPSQSNISAAGPSGGSPSREPASQTSRSGAVASPLRGPPVTSGGLNTRPPGSASRRIQLYMETELMISARDEQQHGGRDEIDFMRILVENHNRQQAHHQQQARSTMIIFSHPNPPDLDDDKWYIAHSVAQADGEYPCKAYPFRLNRRVNESFKANWIFRSPPAIITDIPHRPQFSMANSNKCNMGISSPTLSRCR